MNMYYEFERLMSLSDKRYIVIMGGRYSGRTLMWKRYFVFLLIILIKQRIAELSKEV